MQSLSRAFDVLDLIAKRPQLRATDVSEALGIPWATCHRMLTQLQDMNLIERSMSGEYRMGPRAWLLGSTYLVGHQLIDIGVPVLHKAAEDLPTAVWQLTERTDDVSLVLYSQDASTGQAIARAAYGYHFPLHAGSKGWVLLAYAPEEFIDQYLAGQLLPLTPTTIVDPTELRAKLVEVREQGYAVTTADVQNFTASVAAPIFGSDGAVVAAVCAIVVRSEIEDEQNTKKIIECVLGVAQTLSFGAGWQPIHAARDALNPVPNRRRVGRPPITDDGPGSDGSARV